MKFDVFNSGKSGSLLRSRCQKLFKKNLGVDVYTPMSKNFFWRDKSIEVRDVVLMGDALLLLTNPFLWRKNTDYRFWVLSESHRKLIQKMFGLKKNQMSVIPRQMLMSSGKKINPWPDFAKPSTLVISSRIDVEKNIELTLQFAHELQRIIPKLSVAIFSPSNDLKKLKELLGEFNWARKPRIYGDQGYQWHRQFNLLQPFLVNLSTFVMEDFSVTTAQAREIGWPMILSDWAVFRELGNESIIRINPDDIFQYKAMKTKVQKKKLAKRLVYNSLLGMNKKHSVTKPEEKRQLNLPDTTSAKELLKLQKKWTEEKRLNLVTGIFEEKLQEENIYFKKMRKIFS